MVGVGYSIGPNLPTGTLPWPVGWEHLPSVQQCEHLAWERVLIQTEHQSRVETVVRCIRCAAPRCGHSTDRDPCMRVRHHGDLSQAAGHLRWSVLSHRSFVPDLTDPGEVQKWLAS